MLLYIVLYCYDVYNPADLILCNSSPLSCTSHTVPDWTYFSQTLSTLSITQITIIIIYIIISLQFCEQKTQLFLFLSFSRVCQVRLAFITYSLLWCQKLRSAVLCGVARQSILWSVGRPTSLLPDCLSLELSSRDLSFLQPPMKGCLFTQTQYII